MVDKTVVFILGMGRSGSSALCRVLSLCGCTLPRSVFAPRDINPTGFWEPVEATELNYEFLQRYQVLPTCPPIDLPAKVICNESEKEIYIRDIQKFLNDCPAGPMLVLKCLGLPELRELWSEAASREGIRTKVVIPLRHPREVFASLKAAAPSLMTEDMANVIWLREHLLSEYQSRDMPRVYVEYTRLLNDWRSEIARISRTLSLEFQLDEAAVDAFLTPNLYHQRRTGSPEGQFSPWISKLHTILAEASVDKPIDALVLDRIRHQFCASEAAFRVLTDVERVKDSKKLREHMRQWPVWNAGQHY